MLTEILPWPKKEKKNGHLDYAQNQNTVLITQYHENGTEALLHASLHGCTDA